MALIVAARLATLDAAQWQAARDLGSTRLQTFRHVTWPQTRTTIIGAALIAFTIAFTGATSAQSRP